MCTRHMYVICHTCTLARTLTSLTHSHSQSSGEPNSRLGDKDHRRPRPALAKACSPQEASQLREDSCDATEAAGGQTESETTRRVRHGYGATNSTRGAYNNNNITSSTVFASMAPSIFILFMIMRRPTHTKLFWHLHSRIIYLEYPKNNSIRTPTWYYSTCALIL